jgi:ABC-type branched-subunit amino acid transport system substrate-binding protein
VSGAAKWYVNNVLKGTKPQGLYLVPNLGSSLQGAMGIIAAQRQVGLNLDDTLKVGGGDTQADFTRRVQSIRQHASNFVYNGSNDRALISMRKEAAAQGVDTVKLWACSLSCYTKAFLASGGADVEGTYIYMQFLPFEEASTNKELQRFLDSVGPEKADSFGAQAWQAGVLFKQAIDDVVAAHGPNGITRANLVAALDGVKDFTANGWLGKKDLHGPNPCFLIMQAKNSKWVRVYPSKAGTMDCAASNVTTVTLDPAAEAAKIK